MDEEQTTCTVVLTRAEAQTLRELAEKKREGVLVHSPEYFSLEDIAHKLALALGDAPECE